MSFYLRGLNHTARNTFLAGKINRPVFLYYGQDDEVLRPKYKECMAFHAVMKHVPPARTQIVRKHPNAQARHRKTQRECAEYECKPLQRR